MYKTIADIHTHTIASTHAYSTVHEMVKAAADKGLYAIGFSDHGNALAGHPGPLFFENLRVLPKEELGVKIYIGIEANIIDFEGNLDLSPNYNLDYVIASAHYISTKNPEDVSVEACTTMYLNLCKNPLVNIIGHSGTPFYKYDYEKVIPEFKKHNKLVEINSHTFQVRADSASNCKEIALLCKKYEVPVIVSSDAHYHTYVGEHTKALQMLEDIDFPEELIVNANIDRFNEYMNTHTNYLNNRK